MAIASTSITKQVASSADDAWQVSGGSMFVTDGTLLIKHETVSTFHLGFHWVGIRFQNFGIPKNSYIRSAKLIFHGLVGYSEDLSCIVAGALIGSDGEFTTTANDISSRSVTNNQTGITRYSAYGGVEADYDTIIDGGGNLFPVIQELVDQEGWTTSNAITLILRATNHNGFTTADFTCVSYDGNSSQAPKLVVEYVPYTADVYGSTSVTITNSVDDSGDSHLSTLADFWQFGSNDSYIGLRFRELSLLNSAQIVKAQITRKNLNDPDEWISSLNALVYGNDVDNSSTFQVQPPSLATPTTSEVNAITGVLESTVSSPTSLVNNEVILPIPLHEIIQEIVDRGGWGSGNALSVIFEKYGTSISVPVDNDYEYFDEHVNLDSSLGATLTVWYLLPAIPETIDDLSGSSGVELGTLSLNWTAPYAFQDGVNPSSGTATAYVVRYSPIQITNDTIWNGATVYTGTIPTPSSPGSPESISVTGLQQGNTYYWSVRGYNGSEYGNVSNSPPVLAKYLDFARRYALDGTNFPKNPIQKQWQQQIVGYHGDQAPILPPCWEITLGFGILGSKAEYLFLMDAWINNTRFSAILPHPQYTDLYQFNKVTVIQIDGEFTDIENDSWVNNASVTLRVCDLSDSTRISP